MTSKTGSLRWGTQLTCGYRADGLRAWKEGTTGGKKYFLYDGANPIIELDSSGNIENLNVFAPDGLVGRKEGSTWTYYTFDQQGNVAQRLNSSQVVQTSRVFDAWGEGAETTQPRSLDCWNYNGQWGYYYDRETSLYYCQNRMYDASTGRWINRDPIGYAGGINLYGYCGGGPVGAVDPSGLDALDSFVDWGSDFFGGWGDALTFGGTDLIREGLGVNDQVNKDSTWYKAGQATGAIHGTAIMPGGAGLADDGVKLIYSNGGSKAAHGMYQAFKGNGKVPNPFGKRGDPTTRQTVADCETAVKGANPDWLHVAGGSLPEKLVSGTGRMPDLWFKTPAGKDIFFQVGRTTKSGNPVAREWSAGGDLSRRGEVFFVPRGP